MIRFFMVGDFVFEELKDFIVTGYSTFMSKRLKVLCKRFFSR